MNRIAAVLDANLVRKYREIKVPRMLANLAEQNLISGFWHLVLTKMEHLINISVLLRMYIMCNDILQLSANSDDY